MKTEVMLSLRRTMTRQDWRRASRTYRLAIDRQRLATFRGMTVFIPGVMLRKGGPPFYYFDKTVMGEASQKEKP